jgi:hypothetical protein
MEVKAMLKVKGTTITFNRGDDVCLKVNVYDSEGQPYTLQSGDALYFSAKAKAKDSNYAIPPKKLELDSENAPVIHIEPKDTWDLEFGTYVYDVQMITAGGRSSTIIKPSPLVIEESITAYGDR